MARAFDALGADARVQLRRVPQRGGLRARGGPRVRGQRAGGQAAGRRAAPRPARSFVHLSTNYVFDGTAAEPYDEDALPNPRSIYAISKLAGEHAALAYAPGALVVRTAGLYGLHGSASKGGNFVTRMIARAREQGALKVVADQRLTPTFTADLAAGILAAARGGRHGHAARDQRRARRAGTGSPRRSWSSPASTCPSSRGTTVIAPGAADRPLNGVLRSSVSERAGLAPLRPWRDALADYLERAGLLAASPA